MTKTAKAPAGKGKTAGKSALKPAPAPETAPAAKKVAPADKAAVSPQHLLPHASIAYRTITGAAFDAIVAGCKKRERIGISAHKIEKYSRTINKYTHLLLTRAKPYHHWTRNTWLLVHITHVTISINRRMSPITIGPYCCNGFTRTSATPFLINLNLGDIIHLHVADVP